MAHKKGQGSVKNGRDSHAQRLGVKVFDGQHVHAGSIIVRQRGSRFQPGAGCSVGKDDTVFATRHGVVKFTRGRRGRFANVFEPGSAELAHAQAQAEARATGNRQGVGSQGQAQAS